VTAPGLLSRMRRVVLACLIVYWVAAFVGTHVPGHHLPRVGAGDKLLHCWGYTALACLLWVTLLAHRRARWGVLVVLPLYAALDEITQPLVGRTASIGDWLADVGGVGLAVLVCEASLLALRRIRARGA